MDERSIILSALHHQSRRIPPFPALKCPALPLPLGSLPWPGFIHRRLVTEAGTAGIFFIKMAQSLRPPGAEPGAVFRNQVNHKQALWSPSSLYFHPTDTQTDTAIAKSVGAVSARSRCNVRQHIQILFYK